MGQQVSAFGFSGFDPLGTVLDYGLQSLFGNWVNSASSKRSWKYAKKAAELNYSYYLRSLKESPSAQRLGLEAAGYNPLLALGNIGAMSYGTNASVQGNFSSPSSSGTNGFDADAFHSAKNAFRMKKAELEAAEANSDLIRTQIDKLNADKANDALKTHSQLLNDEIDRAYKQSKTTKTKVDTIADPIGTVGSFGAGAAAGSVGNKAINYLLPKLKQAAGVFGRYIAPSVGSSAAVLGSQALSTLGIGLPLMYGSAKAGEKASRTIREDKDSNWNKAWLRGMFGSGIPSYHNY